MNLSAISQRPILTIPTFGLAIVFAFTACTSINRRVIKNPELNHYDRQRGHYANLFPAKFSYLEETEFDSIDFRQPHEKEVRNYAFLSDPKGDIDRTKGYDPSEYTVTPDLSLLQSPANDVQITWIISYEHILDPPRSLQYAWKEIKPANMRLYLPKMGETDSFDKVSGKMPLMGSGALISTSENAQGR